MSHISDNNLESLMGKLSFKNKSNDIQENQQLLNRQLRKKEINDIRFKSSKNITNERIHTIFSNGRELQEPIEEPYFIVLIGSPGVGKTYTLNNIFGDKLDNFYKVSLDLILEKITPYRNATKKIYNSIKGVPSEQNDPENPKVDFTKSNIKLLNLASTYLSARNNFGIPNRLSNRGLGEKTKNKTKSIYGKFYEIADKAIEYALDKGYNIIYDTTIAANTTKIAKILNMINTKAKRKYKVRVILVEGEGDHNKQVERITSQLNQRHRKMLKDGYIRVINKNSVSKHITENRTGFELSKREFKSTDKYDIEFINISTINVSNKNKYNIQKNNSIDQVIAKIPKKSNDNNQNNINLSNQFKKLTLKNKNNNSKTNN